MSYWVQSKCVICSTVFNKLHGHSLLTCPTCMSRRLDACKGELRSSKRELDEYKVRCKRTTERLRFLCIEFESDPAYDVREGDVVIVVQGRAEEPLFAHKFILLNSKLLAENTALRINSSSRPLSAVYCTQSEAITLGKSSFAYLDLADLGRRGDAQSSKSRVFCKMFNAKMLEEEKGIVNVNDAPRNVIRAVIKFCYNAEVNFTDEVTAEGVLEVAHKYDIVLLQKICEEELIATITCDNLPKRLKIAMKFEAKDLEAAATRFLKQHYDDVISDVLAEMF